MRCALELIKINRDAAAKLEKERQRQLEEEERQRREYLEQRRQKMYEDTIEFCETVVNPALEEAAAEGKDTIVAHFPITLEPDGEFCPLYSRISHAGRLYYLQGHNLSWNVCREYLEQFCITMRAKSDNYACCNGHDYTRGATLIISVEKLDCVKGS